MHRCLTRVLNEDAIKTEWENVVFSRTIMKLHPSFCSCREWRTDASIPTKKTKRKRGANMMCGKVIYEGINIISSPQDKNYNAQSIPDAKTSRFLLNL